jgi:hypothetical protein
MSLSSGAFADSIGTARTEDGYGAVLVYMGLILGLEPCGCDGWSVEIRDDGCVWSHWDSYPEENDLYPPDSTGKMTREERVRQSKSLAKDVHRIREEYQRSLG